MANVKITSGQYVMIEQKIASVSDRVFAQMLDLFFLICYESILSLLFFTIIFYDMSPSDERIAMFFYAFLQLPIVFYHPVCEYFFNGASPGKKILKIKVVHMDGSSPTLGSYLMRWMMYMLECLLLPGIGLLCIIFNKNGQRLGDMMAGTVVIKSDDYLRHRINLNDFGFVNEMYRTYYPEAANLSMRQAEVVRETLLINNSNRDYYVKELSAKIMEHLKIPPLVNGSNEAFLNTILNDYRYYSSRVDI